MKFKDFKIQVFLLIFTLSLGCSEMRKADEKRLAEMEKIGTITPKDGSEGSQSDYERIKPYVRSQQLGTEQLHVVYKAGGLRKTLLEHMRDDLSLQPKDFKKIYTEEKFNAKHFQDYIVWLPKSVNPKKLDIFQTQGKKKIRPFYVEPLVGSNATFQQVFPFMEPESAPILVRFKRQGKVIPSLVVQVERGKEAKFQWRRPKGSRSQRNSPK